jgi:flagellar assembly protein FliH
MTRIIRAGSEESRRLQTLRAAEEKKAPLTPEQLLLRAEETCRAMKEQAEQELRAVREAALAAAHEEGFAAGQKEAVESLAGVLSSLRALEEQLICVKNEQIASAEKDMVELVIGITEKIVRRSVPQERELVTRVVRECIAALKERDGIRIAVNPLDIPAVKEAEQSLKEDFSLHGACVIEPDLQVEKGAARVFARTGGVEGRVIGLLERVNRLLRRQAGLDAPPQDPHAAESEPSCARKTEAEGRA